MAGWIKCTGTMGGYVFVNMANATSVTRYEGQNYSTIAFQGGEQGAVTVKEAPELILSGEWANIT